MMEEPRVSSVGPESEEMQPEDQGRRRFLDYLIGLLALVFSGAFLSIIVSFLRPRTTQTKGAGEPEEVADAAEVPEGTGRVVPYQDTSVIIVHSSQGFVAFSAVCTHLSCLVNFDQDKQQITCPCHGGVFDLNGNVVGGPVPRPLPPYKVEVVGSKVVVSAG